MNSLEFIKKNIGAKVFLVNIGDLRMGIDGKYFRVNKDDESCELTIIKLTQGGKAYLKGDDGKYLSVPPTVVREVGYDYKYLR